MSATVRTARILLAAAAAAAVLASVPASASASIVDRVSGKDDIFSVTAAPGEANTLGWSSGISHSCPASSGGGTCNQIRIQDTAGLTWAPGTAMPPNCMQPSQTEINCLVRDLVQVTIDAGDGNDLVRTRCLSPLCGGIWVLETGAGRDRLVSRFTATVGGANPASQPLNVTVGLGAGDDQFASTYTTTQDLTTFNDAILFATGGAGSDRMSAKLQATGSRKATAVSAQQGESVPPVRLDLLGLFGGGDDDRLRIARGPGTLNGGIGDDRFAGGPGPQRFLGGLGNDLLKNPGPGRDIGNGGPGKDRIHGDPHVNDPGGWDD